MILTHEKGEKMSKKKVDFDTTVSDYLYERGYVRRERFIEYLMENYFHETGFSKPNINKKIRNMENTGLISIETDPDVLDIYGIKKEAKNASYILSKSTAGRTEHIGKMFNLLQTGEDIDEKMALDEIIRYEKKYILNPDKLDTLVLGLDAKKDVSLIDNRIAILYNHIVNKRIKPENETILRGKLRNILERYSEGHIKLGSLKRRVIRLLGYYNDRTVLEQLKRDIESGKLSTFEDYYGDKFTAKVIEEGRTELFEIEKRLRKEGDIKTADTLSRIRTEAVKNAEQPIEPDKSVEEVTGSPESKPISKVKAKGIKK